MQDECPKQVCTLENECLEFAFFDLYGDEGSDACCYGTVNKTKANQFMACLTLWCQNKVPGVLCKRPAIYMATGAL